MTKSQAQLRAVVKIRELLGPNGGTKYVMKLSCGCLVCKSTPHKRVRCIPCWWNDEESKEKGPQKRFPTLSGTINTSLDYSSAELTTWRCEACRKEVYRFPDSSLWCLSGHEVNRGPQ